MGIIGLRIMSVPVLLDGSAAAGWAVRVGDAQHVHTGYMCETQQQALALARAHREQHGETAQAIPVTVRVMAHEHH